MRFLPRQREKPNGDPGRRSLGEGLPALLEDASSLDLRIVGRMLLHAAFVGGAAGLAGAAFYVALEATQHLLLGGLAGYDPLRAAGEHTPPGPLPPFRPWMLVVLPAFGALAGGIVSWFAPEVRGGGSDAMIRAFHLHGGHIRKRVITVKALASIFTLGTGGAGGREGPTMQIGGAIGSLVGRVLRVGERERRILLLAGVAAGLAAVFRTPLGAALLAVEVLYRDGFESDGLVPAVLASVVSYSVVYALLGSAPLFSVPHLPFVPAHLPLYVLLALLCAAAASLFVAMLRGVKRASAALPIPDWARPAVGGLLLGIVATVGVVALGGRNGDPGQGLGILGGGYGAVQLAISGGSWLPEGWGAVQLLGLLCLAKLVAASLTIGTGGSAGDFAPSLAIGGLLGGAFGRVAQLVLDDPSIQPAAFALVGMGAFYGGAAHVPLSAIILVCEMAGSYDLLVPLMFALGISYVALRRVSLYEAQVDTPSQSPVHPVLQTLTSVRVGDRLEPRAHLSFHANDSAGHLIAASADYDWQDVFPVVDDAGRLIGIVTGENLRLLAFETDARTAIVAADLMQPPVWISPDDDVRRAAELLLTHRLRELPVRTADGKLVGLVDEDAVVRLYQELVATPR